MRVNRTVCDVEGCENDALYHITHDYTEPRRLMRTYGDQQVLEVDLCERHAESFAMKGTGAWTGVKLRIR